MRARPNKAILGVGSYATIDGAASSTGTAPVIARKPSLHQCRARRDQRSLVDGPSQLYDADYAALAGS